MTITKIKSTNFSIKL